MAVKITKQLDGTYDVRVWAKHKDVFGKRSTKYKSGFKSAAVATIWGDKAEEDLDRGTNEDITFAELENLYIEARGYKMSPTTHDRFVYLRPRILSYMGKIKARDINTRIVQKYIDDFAKRKPSKSHIEKYKASTIQVDYRHIMAVLNWGVGQDYLEYNRVKRVEFPQDDEEFEPTIIDASTEADVLAYCKKYYYNLYIPILLSGVMGTRRGETLGLKWDVVDFENDCIHLVNNLIITKGEIQDKKKLKTKSSKNILGMSSFLKQELFQHKEMNKYLDNPYVCANVFTGKVPNPSYITKTFKKIITKVFNIDMRFQDLRASFNEIGIDENVDELSRSLALRHTSTKTTRKYYTTNKLKHSKQTMEAISAPIAQAFAEKTNK